MHSDTGVTLMLLVAGCRAEAGATESENVAVPDVNVAENVSSALLSHEHEQHVFGGEPPELLQWFDNVKTGPGVWKSRHYFDVLASHEL